MGDGENGGHLEVLLDGIQHPVLHRVGQGGGGLVQNDDLGIGWGAKKGKGKKHIILVYTYALYIALEATFSFFPPY